MGRAMQLTTIRESYHQRMLTTTTNTYLRFVVVVVQTTVKVIFLAEKDN